MAAPAPNLARAIIDRHDRLVSADEPLAGFHRRCGGDLPGAVVTPALLELVRKSRALNLRLARAIRAADDREAVTMWVEVTPAPDGASAIAIMNWHAEALRPPAETAEIAARNALAAQVAELSARLDPRQAVLSAEGHGDALQELAAAMRAGRGQPWTDFVELEGNAHHQPLHWRLLDGARLRLAGSDRVWQACLVPLGTPEPGSDGFELHLVSTTPPPDPPEPDPPAAPRPPEIGLGREIAPVLRQPVARIIANAETIRTQLAGPLAEEYSAYAADIARAGEHLLSLIDDLATLEMVEDEGFAPAPDQIDLADLARRAAGILGMRARERGIVLDAPKEGETAPAIGEFRRVLQILLNLVGNAIRYSPEGSQVWLRAEVWDGRASITVADQGEGLDEDEQARVFAKFERLGRSGDGGSGLGLYISRRLAEAMGGTLNVESAKGQGARFTLELPGDAGA